jgi:hypothetical protein
MCRITNGSFLADQSAQLGAWGKAASPGLIKKVPAEQLRRMLGLIQVSYVEGKRALAVVDAKLDTAG